MTSALPYAAQLAGAEHIGVEEARDRQPLFAAIAKATNVNTRTRRS
jgi:hypothetical protein